MEKKFLVVIKEEFEETLTKIEKVKM